ncbi:MAG: hypothetical protein AAGA68_26835 [Pseudomonadota bacterium]
MTTTRRPNGDAPFDNVRLAMRDHRRCVVFGASGDQREAELVVFTEDIDELLMRRESLAQEGLDSPVTEEAIRLIRSLA